MATLYPELRSDALTKSATRLKIWCVDHALPLWAGRAQREDGSWVEHLWLDGQPDFEAERRWRVLARQVYVYAKATSAGWYDGLAIAERTYNRMNEIGLVHRVSNTGNIVDATRDLYDHAFYVLAASSLHALTGEAKYLVDADGFLSWIDTDLRHPSGGWKESNRAELTNTRRQNPHMHLLEASMFLYGATGELKHLRFANEVMALFDAYFLDEGTISEFFEADWTLASSNLGQTAEPGHAVEWVWLLGQYQKATGRIYDAAQDVLYRRAICGRGWFLNDEETKSGEVRRDTKRLWVQTEVIKAHLAMAERGISGSSGMAAATIDALFPTYLTSEGLWNDQINACNANVAKTIPVSTLYHIICMATEAERVSTSLNS